MVSVYLMHVKGLIPPPSGKLYVIMEYCSGGNLLQYLRSKRGDKKDPLSTRRLIKMASQVATGMEFLAAKNVSSNIA